MDCTIQQPLSRMHMCHTNVWALFESSRAMSGSGSTSASWVILWRDASDALPSLACQQKLVVVLKLRLTSKLWRAQYIAPLVLESPARLVAAVVTVQNFSDRKLSSASRTLTWKIFTCLVAHGGMDRCSSPLTEGQGFMTLRIDRQTRGDR